MRRTQPEKIREKRVNQRKKIYSFHSLPRKLTYRSLLGVFARTHSSRDTYIK